MKKIIEFLKSIIRRDPTAWIDIEVAAQKAPTIYIGWRIPEVDGINTTLVKGEVVVEYLHKEKVIKVARAFDSEVVFESKLTITNRIFTKVNNILKKNGTEVISKDLWAKFESAIIEAQGKGKGTYSSLRNPVKKTK